MQMRNVITFIPRSRLRLIDVADAAVAAGCLLYQNGRALVAAQHKPGAGWHRVGVPIPDRRGL